MVAGDPGSALKIYVLEGDEQRADRNYGIGLMELRGDQLRTSLPADETVEITYRIDESKTLSAEAVFPSIREVRPMTRHLERPSLTAEEIDIEISKEKERLEAVQRAAPEKIGSDIGRQIVLIEKEKVAAADDPDSRQKAAQQLIELKQAVDSLQKSAEWELLVADFEGYRRSTEQLVGANGTGDQQRELPQLLKNADAAVKEQNIANLLKAVDHIRDIYLDNRFFPRRILEGAVHPNVGRR